MISANGNESGNGDRTLRMELSLNKDFGFTENKWNFKMHPLNFDTEFFSKKENNCIILLFL